MNYATAGCITVAAICLLKVNTLPIQNEISIDDKKIALKCNYNTLPATENDQMYTCALYDLNITTTLEIGSFSGNHSNGKTDKDVEQIQFESGTMFYIPNGIGKFFTNLKSLKVGNISTLTSLGTKALTRLNLKNLGNLKYIQFSSNDIKKVDKDALWDLSKLESFLLNAQRLNFFNVRTLERNNKLKTVAISATELILLYENVFRYNVALESVSVDNNLVETIREGTFRNNLKLVEVSLSSNKLKIIPANLFKNNTLLNGLNFGDNNLEKIKIDFTKMKNIKYINFDGNDCINDNYSKQDNLEFGVTFNDLTQFQKLVKDKCS